MIKGQCKQHKRLTQLLTKWLIYNYCFLREITQQYRCFAFSNFEQYYDENQ